MPRELQKTSRPELTRDWLEADALRYLNRFDASTNRLTQQMRRRVRVVFGLPSEAAEWEEVGRWLQALIERLCEVGVLNDQRLAERRVESLRNRGVSRRALSEKLRVNALPDDVIQTAIAAVDKEQPDADLVAAARLVLRRKLGWCRAEPLRSERQQRDLAVLARAGFGWSVATRALQAPYPEGE